jgi:glycosyltransferase involved in cell wall biosynthesis
MRTAVVTETYPPELNGLAHLVARIVQHLHERGHRIDLVRPAQQGERRGSDASPAAAELRGLGVPLPTYRDLRCGLTRAATLVERWQGDRPGVVHIATEGPLGWAVSRAARQLAIPVSTDFRTNFPAYAAHYGFTWAQPNVLGYLRAFHNRSDLTVVPTGALAAALDDAGFERLKVVGRGDDFALFNPARRSERRRAIWGVAPDQPVLLYVGRLAVEKNVDLVFDTCRAMRGR